MTNEQTTTLVFKDQAGEYYLVSQATLEQGRVPAEQKAALEQLIAEQQEDVQGYILPILYGVAMTVGFAAGYFGTKSATASEEVLVPDLSSVL